MEQQQQEQLNTGNHTKTIDKPVIITSNVNTVTDDCKNDKTNSTNNNGPQVCIRQAVTSRSQED
ncbi:hypothetical protein I4U23_023267 [Adineta vaga]|nr:hypothetical protein I4U23_023267 [Adineta vaga]